MSHEDHQVTEPEEVAAIYDRLNDAADTPLAESLLIVEGKDEATGDAALAIVLTGRDAAGDPYAIAYPAGLDELDELADAIRTAAATLRERVAAPKEDDSPSEAEIRSAQVETDE